ncbi:MAG: TRAP transporter large permease subunit [Candidatus Methylomirabilales bacterium]
MMGFGIDPAHFGIMIIANLGIGYVTPPVGTCLYVAFRISKEPPDRVIKPLVPHLLVMVVMLAVVTFVPDLTLVVPRLLYRK